MQRTVAPAIRVGGRRVPRPLRTGRGVRNDASEPVDHHWNKLKKYPFSRVSNRIDNIALEGSTDGDAGPTSWATTLSVHPININLKAGTESANSPIYFQQCHAIWVGQRAIREVTGSLPSLLEKASAFDGKSQNHSARKLAADFISWGYRAVPGVSGVIFNLSVGMWRLESPAVLRGPDGYLFFGRINLEEQPGPALAGVTRPDDDEVVPTLEGPCGNESTEIVEESVPDIMLEEALSSEEGLSKEDIQLVVGQVGCTRGAAVQALRQHNGDIVNAIMSLAN